MSRYTDDDIRNMNRVSCQVAASYLSISPMSVMYGVRNNLLPIGFAYKNEDRHSDNWSYHIVPERLIAYKYGRINIIALENIENSISTIAEKFEEMKRDLLFLLSENEGLEGTSHTTK